VPSVNVRAPMRYLHTMRGIPFRIASQNPRRKNPMSKTTATFYHAGCPVCLDAESAVTRYLDTAKVNLEVVHLGTAKHRVAEPKPPE
jgi:predicted transporter